MDNKEIVVHVDHKTGKVMNSQRIEDIIVQFYINCSQNYV